MKATETNKPDMLKQNDIVSFYHIQMPHWLFADKRYNQISLAAKVAYSLLLNRYQLSKLHGWVNEDGAVYIIYLREELSKILQVGATKAISVFKELVDAGLVWKKRRGHNKANHIFLTRVELSDEDAASYDNAPFITPQDTEDADDSGSVEFTCPEYEETPVAHDNTEKTQPCDIFGHLENTPPEAQNPQVMMCEKQTSGHPKNTGHDMRNSSPSYINSSSLPKLKGYMI